MINDDISLLENTHDYKQFSLNKIDIYAKIISVYDGDTFSAGVLYKNDFYKFTFRIANINTPEIKNDYENAIKSRNRFLQLAGLDINLTNECNKKTIIDMLKKYNIIVFLKCKSFDKYGRTLCDVYSKDKSINIGLKLIEEQYACKY